VPALFVTVSPDDVNHSFVVKMHRFLRRSAAVRYMNILADPDNVQVTRTVPRRAAAAAAAGADDAGNNSDEIPVLNVDPLEALLEGDTEVVSTWERPFDRETYSRLHYARSSNAAAMAGMAGSIFHDIIDGYNDIMVGVSRNGGGSLAKNPRRPDGVFGVVTAWHGVVECQAKGTLHWHSTLHGSLSPELLSRAIDDAMLRQKAAQALDSMMLARAGAHLNETFATPERRFCPGSTPAEPFVMPDFVTCVPATIENMTERIAAAAAAPAAAPGAPAADPGFGRRPVQNERQRGGGAAAAAAPEVEFPEFPDVTAETTVDLDEVKTLSFRDRSRVEPGSSVFVTMLQWCPCEAHANLRRRICNVQVHSHSTTCWKKGCLCRMGFPCTSPTETRPLELLKNFAAAGAEGAAAKTPSIFARIAEVSRRQLLTSLRAPGAAASDGAADATSADAVADAQQQQQQQDGQPPMSDYMQRLLAEDSEDSDGGDSVAEHDGGEWRLHHEAGHDDGVIVGGGGANVERDDDDAPAAPPPPAAAAAAAAGEQLLAPVRQQQKQKKPERRKPLMTASGAFFDVEYVPVEEVAARFPDPADLAERRRAGASDGGDKAPRHQTPLERLGIKNDPRVIVWTLKRATDDFDVCPFAIALLAVFGCNCAVIHLGSRESAVAVAFYCANYCCKDGLKLEHALPVIKNAAAKALCYSSSAPDADTQTRQDNYLVQMALNSIHTIQELPVTMASSICLHRKTHDSSHLFSWVYPVHAGRLIASLHGPAPRSAPRPRAGGAAEGSPAPAVARGLFRDVDAESSDSDASSRASSPVAPVSAVDATPGVPEFIVVDDPFDGEVRVPNPDYRGPRRPEPAALSSAAAAADGDVTSLASIASNNSAATAIHTPAESVSSERRPLAGFSGQLRRGQGGDTDLGYSQGRRERGADDGVDGDFAEVLGADLIAAALDEQPAPLHDNDGMATTISATAALEVDSEGKVNVADLIQAYAHRGLLGEPMNDLLLSGSEDAYSPPLPRDKQQQMLDGLGNLTLYEFVALINSRAARPTRNAETEEAKVAEKMLERLMSPWHKGRDNDDIVHDMRVGADSDDDADELANPAGGGGTLAETIDEALGELNMAVTAPRGARFFSPTYQGFSTRMMRVNRTYRVPRFAGRVVGSVTARSTAADMDALAVYFGALFTPWSADVAPAVRSWDSFERWFCGLKPEQSVRQRGIYNVVRTMLTYHSSRETRQMLNSWRMRCAASKYLREFTFTPHRVAGTAEEQLRIDEEAVRAANMERRALSGKAAAEITSNLAIMRQHDPRDVELSTALFDANHRRLLVARAAMANGTLGAPRVQLDRMLASRLDGKNAEAQFEMAFAMRNEDDKRDGEEGGAHEKVKIDAATRRMIAERAEAARQAELAQLDGRARAAAAALNPEQAALFKIFTKKLEPRMQDAITANDPGVLITLLGTAGSGKSFLVQALSAWALAKSRGQRFPLVMAFTGIAASLIDGMTLHRGLMLHMPHLDEETRLKLRARLDAAPYIIIDEISMVGCLFFSQIVARLEEIYADKNNPQNSVLFGDARMPPIILVGDFAQLPCVSDTPLTTPLSVIVEGVSSSEVKKKLFAETVGDLRARAQYLRGEAQAPPAAAAVPPNAAGDIARGRGRGRGRGQPAQQQGGRGAAAGDDAAVRDAANIKLWAMRVRGRYYFSQFSCYELASQQRATCAKQLRRLQYMHGHGSVPPIFDPASEYFIDQLTLHSSDADVKRFRFAPIVTSRNATRHAYNFGQAQSFAAAHGVPMVVWKKRMKGSRAEETEIVRNGYDDLSSAFYGVFVVGAPAMIGANVCPHLSIANGTSGWCHSLTWKAADASATMRERILATGPGQIVEVTQPDFFNIVIASKHVLPLDRVAAADAPGAEFGADHTGYLLPMQIWTVKAEVRNGVRIMPTHMSHRIDLGFCFTFYRTQGGTYTKGIILDLNFAPTDAKFSALFVGVTRVRKADDLRILPIRQNAVVQRVQNLKVDAEVRKFMKDRVQPAIPGTVRPAPPPLVEVVPLDPPARGRGRGGGGRGAGGGRGGRGRAPGGKFAGAPAAAPAAAAAAVAPAPAAPKAPAPRAPVKVRPVRLVHD
jgi:hypothetical protein